ncbi:MAG: ribbon-helix-helix protein, CopG family [Nitrospinae bacterium]|nr:ribbon-helix-helix protein, CopG family [Nitrospinota bacterium]
MATISIRLTDKLLSEVSRNAKKLRVPRAQYIRAALESAAEKSRHEERGRKIREVSLKVRGESMKVNAEFADTERDPKD